MKNIAKIKGGPQPYFFKIRLQKKSEGDFFSKLTKIPKNPNFGQNRKKSKKSQFWPKTPKITKITFFDQNRPKSQKKIPILTKINPNPKKSQF